MKKLKNNLDERQEQALLKIEHNGCWFAFWGLLVAWIVQLFIYGFDFKYVAGEWVIFTVLAAYLGYACIKNGIWDRHLQPNAKTNMIVSLIASLAFGAFTFFRTYVTYPDKIVGSVVSGVISAVMIFFLCFAALAMSAYAFKKKRQELEQEPNDEEVNEDK